MATNWKTLVEKENSKTYVLPDGWDSRDHVAEQLECSPEKVDDNLRPALKSGKVQKQQFRVWDAALKRVVLVVAYHDTSRDSRDNTPKESKVAEILALKKEGKTWAEIGAKVGMSESAARGLARRSNL